MLRSGETPDAASPAARRARLGRFGRNELPATPPVPARRQFLAQFRNPLTILLLAATSASISTGSPTWTTRARRSRPGATTTTATTEGIAGRRAVATLGLALGVAVRRRGIGANIMAGFDALGNGGAPGELGEELAATRREAVAQLATRAAELGAEAVVAVRFDTPGSPRGSGGCSGTRRACHRP